MHAFFGFVAAVILTAFGVHLGTIGVVLVVFGSLLPDIDHPRAIVGRFNLFNRFGLFTHRGKCHTLIGSFLLSTPFYLVSGTRSLLLVFVGAVSHLWADKLYSFGKRKKPFTIRLW